MTTKNENEKNTFCQPIYHIIKHNPEIKDMKIISESFFFNFLSGYINADELLFFSFWSFLLPY